VGAEPEEPPGCSGSQPGTAEVGTQPQGTFCSGEKSRKICLKFTRAVPPSLLKGVDNVPSARHGTGNSGAVVQPVRSAVERREVPIPHPESEGMRAARLRAAPWLARIKQMCWKRSGSTPKGAWKPYRMYNYNIYWAVARCQCVERRELPGQQAGVPQVGQSRAWKLLTVKKLLYKSKQLGENAKNNARSFNHR